MPGICVQKPSRLILVIRLPGYVDLLILVLHAWRRIQCSVSPICTTTDFQKSSRRLEIIPKQVTKSSQKWLGLRCTAARGIVYLDSRRTGSGGLRERPSGVLKLM
jgi:hypothetical protein